MISWHLRACPLRKMGNMRNVRSTILGSGVQMRWSQLEYWWGELGGYAKGRVLERRKNVNFFQIYVDPPPPQNVCFLTKFSQRKILHKLLLKLSELKIIHHCVKETQLVVASFHCLHILSKCRLWGGPSPDPLVWKKFTLIFSFVTLP